MSKKQKLTKKVELERERRIKSLRHDAEHAPKRKHREAAQAELDALLQVRGDFHPSTAPTAGRRSVELVPAGTSDEPLPPQPVAFEPPSAPSSVAPAAASARLDGEDEVAFQWRMKAEREAAIEHERARRTMVDPDQTAKPEAEVVADTPARAVATSSLPFVVPEDPVLTNGNGRPQIYIEDPKAPGKAKLVAYTRVTTYIDSLEDRSMLEKWKTRTLLEGAALEREQLARQEDGFQDSVDGVSASMQRRDWALRDLDERERGGDVFTHLWREQAAKEHRDFTNRIVENLLDIGGAHAKADAGTRLHRLTEIVDGGDPLPEWATESERLDVDAYRRAVEQAGLEVLWSERRVVDDDLGITGTMDRAYLAKLPGRTRRVRVVGDVKTGNVEWGAGKIGMQLAAYARGKGYRHDAEDFGREDLRLSRTDGLLIHLPAGEHRCSIYLVDLTLAAKGLALSAEVRSWRNAGKRVYDLKKPFVAVEGAQS